PPGISCSGSLSPTRSHAVPDVIAWNEAPGRCGRSRPHGAHARTLTISATLTRLRSSTSESGSIEWTISVRALQNQSLTRRLDKNRRGSVILLAAAATYGVQRCQPPQLQPTSSFPFPCRCGARRRVALPSPARTWIKGKDSSDDSNVRRPER